MGKVGNPNLVAMTSGGNNAGFASVIENCIYHPDPTTNYGKAYADDTDGTGKCAMAMKSAKNYITNFMPEDLSKTIDDILIEPIVKSDADFLLYVTGYAQFFGTDYDAWCDTYSLNIPSIISRR